MKLFGGAPLNETNANGSLYIGSVSDGIVYGLATSDVTSVISNNLKAKIIPLEDEDLKIWVFYDFEPNIDIKPEFLK